MDKINSAIYDIDANENSSENVYEIAQTAIDHFKYRKSFLALLLNDRDVDEIEMLFEDLKSAAESESQTDLIKAKRRLISKLEQMKRLCAFNIDSVF